MLRLHSAGLLAALLLPATAGATSLVPLTVEQMTDASEAVVRGLVDALWVEEDERGQLWTHAEIEVLEVYKGPPGLDALDVQVMGGTLNGVTMWVDGSPRFSEGEELVLFAERTESGRLTVCGMREGKYTVRVDPDTGERVLVQFQPRPEMPYDARFIPFPPPDQRLALDELAERVRARAREGWDGRPLPGKSLEVLRRMYPDVEPRLPDAPAAEEVQP